MATLDVARIDAAGFRRELDALRAETIASLGPDDYRHLRKMEWAGRGLTLLGYALAWIAVNPVSVVAIALGITARWMLMHHIGHGGYDRVPGVPARYTKKHFALGARRWLDWFDWIEPSAWNHEHNHLHHYHTSEPADPDLVDRNLVRLRDLRAPRWFKWIALFVGGSLWKLWYYAPSALNGLTAKERLAKGAPHQHFINSYNFWDLRDPLVRRVWTRSVAPYGLFHFVIVPCAFLPLGTGAATAVLINRLLAEVLANLHTFFVIVPSHTASDLIAFEGPIHGKDEFYLRQALSTANYPTGGDVNDFLHMWINYQIEHHLFPDLPMSKYRAIQPRVKAICARYGVPYIQQSAGARFVRLVDVCTGHADMPRWSPTPQTA